MANLAVRACSPLIVTKDALIHRGESHLSLDFVTDIVVTIDAAASGIDEIPVPDLDIKSLNGLLHDLGVTLKTRGI